MNLLLDTHTFIWWDANARQLSENARTLITDTSNSVYLSLASVWEIQIKRNLGKLELRKPIQEILREQRRNGINLLPITLDHLIRLKSLGDYHRDPFDRLLIGALPEKDLSL